MENGNTLKVVNKEELENQHAAEKKRRRNIILLSVFGVLLVVGVVAWRCLLNANKLAITEDTVIYIPTGSDYRSAVDTLLVHNCLKNTDFFSKLARYKKYPSHVRPGRYLLKPDMNVNTLLNKLKSGNQDAVRVTIGKFRTKATLAGRVSRKFEFDSLQLLNALNNDSLMGTFGYSAENAIAIFTQNTYEIYWNTSPEDFLARMKTETDRFWKGGRYNSAKKMEMTVNEIVTLASIVEEETNRNDEKADIASVYLNRLRKGMLLQADPTVKFALQDFEIRRVLNRHLQYDSPYNTYKCKGLPPAPICVPSQKSIDAVLENKKTDYLYFCAKEDFSGYHNFARSVEEHNINAAKFRNELNKRKIYK